MTALQTLLRTLVYTALLLLPSAVVYGQPPSTNPPLYGSSNIRQYAIFADGTHPAMLDSTRYGVTIQDSSIVNGSIGSQYFVQLYRVISVNGSIYSGNRMLLSNGNTLNGNIVARNDLGSTAPAVSSGLNTMNLIHARGHVVVQVPPVAGFTFNGPVRTQQPYLYAGPTPVAGATTVPFLDMPVLPTLPIPATFPAFGSNNITGTTAINPGVYGDMTIDGTNVNNVITFLTPGTYVFKSIQAIGRNGFDFTFPPGATGTYRIYVHEDVTLSNLVTFINGALPTSNSLPLATRIYLETHGTGSSRGSGGYAFSITETPTRSSNWSGTVYATAGSILAGTGNNNTTVHGALWSKTQVVVGRNASIHHEPLVVYTDIINPVLPQVTGGRVPTGNKIGAELTSVSTNGDALQNIAAEELFDVAVIGGVPKIKIEVIASTLNYSALYDYLISQGFDTVTVSPVHLTLTGWFPVNKLLDLNLRGDINYARPFYKPLNNAGLISSQGDTAMKSKIARERFGLDGTGVKIGVISDSYNSRGGALNDVRERDLPGSENPDNTAPVQVLRDVPDRTDEGRAMSQIAFDIAPKATLAFRTGFNSAVDFAVGIRELAEAGCQVIVDDLTYITEPFFTDGVVARSVAQAVGSGVTYLTSAGNFGKNSYEAPFNAVDLPSTIATNLALPSTAKIHQFQNGTVFKRMSLGVGSYVFVLQWDDLVYSLGGNTGATRDLDIYVTNDAGVPLFGFNRDNIVGDPFEVIAFNVTAPTTANLIVVSAGGAVTNRFKFVMFRGNGTLLDNEAPGIVQSTVVAHASSNSAITVGAMLFANPTTLGLPAPPVPFPSVASFSSRGGTLMSGESAARRKPDLIAPNGVNTSVNLNGPVINDGDSYPNFLGTSASAPHAAGVAALLVQARRKFYLRPELDPADIRNLMQTTAQPLTGQTGHDFSNGWGYIQADKTLLSIANARPLITRQLEVIDGVAGQAPFTVKVTGAYLTAQTKIYFNGAEVSGTTVDLAGGFATAVINSSFSLPQNPPVQLYNPPITPSGLDGGLSESRYFFGEKRTVVVKADDKTRRYGEANPVLTFSATIDGVAIDRLNPALTLAQLQLDGDNIALTTNAVPSSEVRSYNIFIRRTRPADADIADQYEFVYVNGSIRVDKMPLTIRPVNKSVRYGQDIGSVQYTYTLGGTLSGTFTIDSVAELHRRFIADNTVAVMNGYASSNTGIINYALNNMSLMASYQSLRNARKFTVSNSTLAPMPAGTSIPWQDQRLLVDLPALAVENYALNPAQGELIASPDGSLRSLLGARALANGEARILANGQLRAMVNGKLLAMVNGQLLALVNGQLRAMVNAGEAFQNARDMVFQNGKLLAMVNGSWVNIVEGHHQTLIGTDQVRFELTVESNGQLRAMVNNLTQGTVTPMVLENGQLRAMVNGKLLAMVNGQLLAMVNGQLLPMVNGEVAFMVNGQLRAMVNGNEQNADQLVVQNGQLRAMVNGLWETATTASYTTRINEETYTIQYSILNGQLRAMVNGTEATMANSVMQFALPNGQLLAMVNGKLLAMVNEGGLLNGKLLAMVNGGKDLYYADYIEYVEANGQLRAMVNGELMPITNGKLLAMVNGQLLAMVNGQLLAMVNEGGQNRLTFAIFSNGQLLALVNGKLLAMVNSGATTGQVNGQLRAMVNGEIQVVTNYQINNGQLEVTLANGQTLAMVNGKLLAMVNEAGTPNGQLRAMVNNENGLDANNNSNTAVVVDGADVNLQQGIIGGMIAINGVTGLEAGTQKLIPAAFVHPAFDVRYETGVLNISPAPLVVAPGELTKVYGDPLTQPLLTGYGFVLGEGLSSITAPTVQGVEASTAHLLPVGLYPITLSGGSAANYTLLLRGGTLRVTPAPLTIKADLKYVLQGQPLPVFTSTITGLKNGDLIPASALLYSASAVNTSVPGEYSNLPSYAAGLPALPYANYTTTFVPGPFYVNPYGTTARKIVNKRECVRPLRPGDAGYGGVYTHMALFSYSNPNATPVYIPRGADNQVVNREAGLNNGPQKLPEVFQPGAYHEVVILFQGQQMQWEVRSMDTYHKTAVTSEVSQTSPRCEAITVMTRVAETAAEGEEGEGANTIYPNPASDRVRLRLSDATANEKELVVMTADGRIVAARGVRRTGSYSVEMTVGHLTSGVYLVRIPGKSGVTVLRFTRL